MLGALESGFMRNVLASYCRNELRLGHGEVDVGWQQVKMWANTLDNSGDCISPVYEDIVDCEVQIKCGKPQSDGKSPLGVHVAEQDVAPPLGQSGA